MPVPLNQSDVTRVIGRLPKETTDAWKDIYDPVSAPVALAGGFIRATIAGESTQDIDLFVGGPNTAELLSRKIRDYAPAGSLSYDRSENAITLKGLKYVVQIIFKFPFDRVEQLLSGFDYSIAKAAIEWNKANRTWVSTTVDNYYCDLAAKRLTYSDSPNPGGSVARLLKFTRLGYTIDQESLAKLLTRFADAAKATEHNPPGEISRAIDPALSVLKKVKVSS